MTTAEGIIVERDLHYDQLHHARDLKALADELREEIAYRRRSLGESG